MHSKISNNKHKLEFDAIGTHWTIDFLAGSTDIGDKIQARIEEFDHTYSRFRPDSIVSKIAKEAGDYVLPSDAVPLISLYKDLYTLTSGVFTPLIGNVISDAGYDATYSLKPKPLLKPSSLEETIEFNPPVLTVKKPVILDFGAAGKGYLVDIIGSLLQENGIVSFIIDAGGDILVSSFESKIALENPKDTKTAIGVVEMNEGSISGSAGNRRNWGKFHHIINPHTLTSPTEVEAVWVIAKVALLADALSTCLFFVNPDTLKKYEFDYLILYPDFSINRSKGFKAKIYESNR